MTQPLKITLKTLTPLWTGGVDGTSDRLHATGIIGSLRWWYEAIVRGLGGRVCDVTAEDTSQRCIFEQKNGESFEQAYNRLCLACRLFGCTGWRRRFRLDVTGLYPQNVFFAASKGVYVAAGNWLWRMFGGEDLGGHKKGRGAAVQFTFGVQALWGQEATLRVVPFTREAEDDLARVAFLLEIVTRWGALGAKPQHGFGQVEVTDGLDAALIEKGKRLILADTEQVRGDSSPEFFALDSFFSHLYQLGSVDSYFQQLRYIGDPPQGFLFRQHFMPCAFDIRYKSHSRDFRTGQGQDFGMRPWLRERYGKGVAHQLFGRSNARRDDERSAGRIHVSHPFRTESNAPWKLKVWGHIPSDLRDDKGRNISVQDVEEQIVAFVQRMFPGSRLLQTFDREEVLRS